MADLNAEAVAFAKKMGSRLARGVASTDHPGVSVIYGPESEFKQVHAQVAAAGIETLGAGLSHVSSGAYAFAILVRADVDALKKFLPA